jgi:multidrug resistance efflux pump
VQDKHWVSIILILRPRKADATILQATAGYNNAKKDYDRFVTLFKQQSASKRIDDMTARYEMTKGLERQNKCEMKF